MTDVETEPVISPENAAIQEQIQAGAAEVAFRLGSLVFRREFSEGTRLTHWFEPGSVVAVESTAEPRTLEQLFSESDLVSEQVIEAVSVVTEVPFENIVGPGRTRDEIMARRLVTYILRVHGDMSYPKIGQALDKDHSSAIHAYKRIQEQLAEEKRKPTGEITVALRRIEATLAKQLVVLNDAEKEKAILRLLDAVAVTKDGLHSYPTSKIKPLYAKILRIRDIDTLVLEHDRRTVSNELLQTYGGYALDLLSSLKPA